VAGHPSPDPGQLDRPAGAGPRGFRGARMSELGDWHHAGPFRNKTAVGGRRWPSMEAHRKRAWAFPCPPPELQSRFFGRSCRRRLRCAPIHPCSVAAKAPLQPWGDFQFWRPPRSAKNSLGLSVGGHGAGPRAAPTGGDGGGRMRFFRGLAEPLELKPSPGPARSTGPGKQGYRFLGGGGASNGSLRGDHVCSEDHGSLATEVGPTDGAHALSRARGICSGEEDKIASDDLPPHGKEKFRWCLLEKFS